MSMGCILWVVCAAKDKMATRFYWRNLNQGNTCGFRDCPIQEVSFFRSWSDMFDKKCIRLKIPHPEVQPLRVQVP